MFNDLTPNLINIYSEEDIELAKKILNDLKLRYRGKVKFYKYKFKRKSS